MALERMPRYDVSNDGMGPYAIFYCDRDGREYRSTPNIATTVKENVTRGALGGFLRNVPILGDQAANQVDNDRYRTDMSADELNSAWNATKQYFRSCPTCSQIVCVPDFDEPTGFCKEDSPRRAEVEAAQAQQSAAALKGLADVFGISGAIKGGMAAAQAQSEAGMATCPKDGTKAAAGTGFCPNCGSVMTQPAPVAQASTSACPSCGTAMAAGVKFCPNCGTPAAQPKACASCGTEMAAGVKFCPNCGTPAT
ncbi:MAG TPA: zinc ribbon domain-containing protein [Candidatus Limnocylindrales bacterium]|nr:zinc ribbon domain-containing protein [Candidatus Limnocylindrales bacterium]